MIGPEPIISILLISSLFGIFISIPPQNYVPAAYKVFISEVKKDVQNGRSAADCMAALPNGVRVYSEGEFRP